MREIARLKLDCFVVHTGQHYSASLDSVFFEQLGLPPPKYNLHVGSGTHAEETGRMLIAIEGILLDEKPSIVLTEGDTNSVLAACLAASKLGIKLAHVEAGARSFDRRMPEEVNRVIADHLSDYLFASTEEARKNLIAEGIADEKIFVTGSTAVDAVKENAEIASHIELDFVDPGDKYAALTLHRQESVDDKDRLESILDGVVNAANALGLKLVYPMHPRTAKRIKEFELEVPREIKVVPPQKYFEFLKVISNAQLVFTDSGGVQEETCIVKVPCVTLSESTAWPETLAAGSNVLGGYTKTSILRAARQVIRRKRNWGDPLGDGQAGRRTVRILKRLLRTAPAPAE